jgi:hypothetical protein
MLLHTGTERTLHIEVAATAVAMSLDGMLSEKVDDVVGNPARIGAWAVSSRAITSPPAWRRCRRTPSLVGVSTSGARRHRTRLISLGAIGGGTR